MDREEALWLLEITKKDAQIPQTYTEQVAYRDYFVSHFTIGTGLRVMELAALKCGDLFLKHIKKPALLVRNGKGGKQRLVFLPRKIKQLCIQYLEWKQSIGEPIDANSPLIMSTRTGGHMTTRGLQKSFKRCAKKAKLESHYSIHSLRHTYATFLYKSSNCNLRLVQKQLGHARITTTQVYADVMSPDVGTALEKLML